MRITGSPTTPTLPNQPTQSNKEIKDILTLLNHDVYWCQEVDKLDKRYKKLNGQAEQYRATNFSSAMALVDQQTYNARIERDKANLRRRAEEEKLLAAVADYESHFSASVDARIQEAVKTIKASAPLLTMEDVDKRLEEFGERMAKEQSKMAEEARAERQLMESKYESLISSLSTSIQQEQAKSAGLSAQLAEEQAKMASLCAEVDQLSKRLQTAINSQNTATTTNKKQSDDHGKSLDAHDKYISSLPSRLSSLDEKLADVERTCQSLKRETARIPTSPPRTPNASDCMSSALQDQLARFEKLEEEVATLTQQLEQPRGESTTSTSLTTETIRSVAQEMVDEAAEKIQKSLYNMAAGFGKQMDNERTLMDQLETKTNTKTAAVDKDLGNLKSEFDIHESKMSSLATLFQGHKDDTNKAMSEYNFQLRCLAHWQNNWDTSALYDKIIAYIGSTYPQGLVQQTEGLSRRLGNVESWLQQIQRGVPTASPLNPTPPQNSPNTQPASVPTQRGPVRASPTGLVAPHFQGPMPGIRAPNAQAPQLPMPTQRAVGRP